MNKSSSAKSSVWKRTAKHLALFVGMLLGLYFSVRFGVGLLGTDEQQIETLERWKNSGMLVWIRYSLYGVILVFWGSLLRKLNPKLSANVVLGTYRPLVIGMLLYEFFLARNLIGQLINS